MTATTTDATTELPNESPPAVDLRIAEDGSLLIPREVCDAFGLDPGDSVVLERALVGLTVTPFVTDEEAEAFWGPNIWQELAEAEADVAAGRSTFYGSDEEFLAALESREHADVRGE